MKSMKKSENMNILEKTEIFSWFDTKYQRHQKNRNIPLYKQLSTNL